MIDRYFEEQVTRSPETTPSKKIGFAKVTKWIGIVGLFLWVFLLYGVIDWTPVIEGPKLGAAIYVIAQLLPLAFFAGMWIFSLKALKKLTEEFDYILNGNLFRVVRVTNFSRRKLFLEFSVSNIEKIGKISGESYEKTISQGGLKKVFAVVDYKNEDMIYYALINDNDGVRKILHFEPSDDLLREIRMTLGRDILEKN